MMTDNIAAPSRALKRRGYFESLPGHIRDHWLRLLTRKQRKAWLRQREGVPVSILLHPRLLLRPLVAAVQSFRWQIESDYLSVKKYIDRRAGTYEDWADAAQVGAEAVVKAAAVMRLPSSKGAPPPAEYVSRYLKRVARYAMRAWAATEAKGGVVKVPELEPIFRTADTYPVSGPVYRARGVEIRASAGQGLRRNKPENRHGERVVFIGDDRYLVVVLDPTPFATSIIIGWTRAVVQHEKLPERRHEDSSGGEPWQPWHCKPTEDDMADWLDARRAYEGLSKRRQLIARASRAGFSAAEIGRAIGVGPRRILYIVEDIDKTPWAPPTEDIAIDLRHLLVFGWREAWARGRDPEQPTKNYRVAIRRSSAIVNARPAWFASDRTARGDWYLDPERASISEELAAEAKALKKNRHRRGSDPGVQTTPTR